MAGWDEPGTCQNLEVSCCMEGGDVEDDCSQILGQLVSI